MTALLAIVFRKTCEFTIDCLVVGLIRNIRYWLFSLKTIQKLNIFGEIFSLYKRFTENQKLQIKKILKLFDVIFFEQYLKLEYSFS